MTAREKLLLVADISPDPKQPRKRFTEDHISSLAKSIDKRGQLQAIIVRPWPKDRGKAITPYMIVAGECRWRAHQAISKARIKAVVRHDMDAREVRLVQAVENLRRCDMNPMEEARAFKGMADDGMTVAEIVEELGYKSANAVTSKLALLNLRPEIQQLVETGNLASSIAWGIAQAPPQFQMNMLRDHQSGKLKTQEQVRHAGMAIREACAQTDIFAKAPKASKRDVEKLHGLEAKIRSVSSVVQDGFEDGEVVAAQRVNPGRVLKLADECALIRRHLQIMEHDLRKAGIQGEIMLEGVQ